MLWTLTFCLTTNLWVQLKRLVSKITLIESNAKAWKATSKNQTCFKDIPYITHISPICKKGCVGECITLLQSNIAIKYKP